MMATASSAPTTTAAIAMPDSVRSAPPASSRFYKGMGDVHDEL